MDAIDHLEGKWVCVHGTKVRNLLAGIPDSGEQSPPLSMSNSFHALKSAACTAAERGTLVPGILQSKVWFLREKTKPLAHTPTSAQL